MDKVKQLRYEMVNNTCGFLERTRAIWSSNVRASERVEELLEIRKAIRAANMAFVNADTSSDTQAQEAALYRATELVLRLANAVMEWALNQNNKSLEKTVDCSPSEIRHIRQAEAIDRLNRIYLVCETELPNIPGCGLSGEDLRAARAAIDEYVALKSGKSQKRTARKAARLNIEQLVQRAGQVLKQLDLLIQQYERSHPDFFQEYRLTRKVINTGGPKKNRAPGLKATDFPTRMPGEPKGQGPAQPGPEDDAPDADLDPGAVA